MSGALAARYTDKEFEKGRVERTKVRRYRAGEVPDWADDANKEAQVLEARRPNVAAPVILKKTDDPRLRRLAQSAAVDREEAIQRHREIRAAEIVRRHREESEEEAEKGADEEAEAQEEEVDEEEITKRREAVRARLLAQQQAREAAAQQQAQASEEEEESSEYETDSEEEEEEYGRRLIKPVFVPKEDRDTIAERERLEREAEEAAAREKSRREERKGETRQLVHEVIQQERAAAQAQAGDGPIAVAEDIDTGDENEEEEFEAWKQRELARIRRERELREAAEKEAELREKLRNMTEEERAAWERANPKEPVDKAKKKWKFMQKYWHVGAYYQTEADDNRGTAGGDEIYRRDYSGATGEDKLNRSILPKVMQVKNFGRSGRSKWTHLVAEDTTRAREDALNTADEARAKFLLQRHQQQGLQKPKKFQR